MAQERTLSRHVGAGHHQDLASLRIELNVVGDVGFSQRQLPFNHGVPAFGNLDSLRLRHAGPGVTQFRGRLCVTRQHVEQAQGPGIRHEGTHFRDARGHQCRKCGVFEGFSLLLGLEDLGF